MIFNVEILENVKEFNGNLCLFRLTPNHKITYTCSGRDCFNCVGNIRTFKSVQESVNQFNQLKVME